MDVFDKPKVIDANVKKRDIPEGLWVKCKDCGEMIFAKDNAAEEGFNRWTINGKAYPMTQAVE